MRAKVIPLTTVCLLTIHYLLLICVGLASISSFIKFCMKTHANLPDMSQYLIYFRLREITLGAPIGCWSRWWWLTTVLLSIMGTYCQCVCDLQSRSWKEVGNEHDWNDIVRAIKSNWIKSIHMRLQLTGICTKYLWKMKCIETNHDIEQLMN